MAGILVTQLSEFFNQVSSWPTSKLVTVSALSGITSHVVFFVHGELDHLAQQIFIGFFLVPTSFFAGFFFHLQIPILQSLVTTATIWVSFVAGLTASILTYRLFLHPLRKFPGPVMARTSKWWGVVKTAGVWQNHYLVYNLHQQYGDFVRIGPNEISVNNQAIIPLVTKLDKGPWYNIGLPDFGTHLTRNRETHRIRRRVWDRAFTDEAVKQYLSLLATRSTELLSILATKANGQVNITEYFSYYMWDSMGDMTFSKSFNMLPTQGSLRDNQRYIKITMASQYGLALFGHIPYIVRILQLFPFLNKEYNEFLRWCDELVEERKTRNPEKKDIFSYILAAEDTNKGVHRVGMEGEARLAILAGTDTTAATLTNICLNLAKDQRELKKLQDEVDALYSAYDGDEEKLFKGLAFDGCPNTQHLESVIREALRINPVVPSSPQRISPPKGLTVGDTYIPGGTAIYVPQFTTFRDGRYFERPTEFIPERWYKPEKYPLTHEQTVFIPFWAGTYSCVGKPLAYMQLRIVISSLVRRFSFELAEDMSEEKLMKEAKDMFILYMGDVKLMLKERNLD